MEFLAWHYTYGIKFYLDRYVSSLYVVVYYFSLPLLIPTLFMPWKRLIVVSSKPGFNIFEYFQNLSFNFVSRFIGAFVRLILLFVGALSLLFIAIAGLLGVVVWLLVPFLSLPIYKLYLNKPSRIIGNLVAAMRDAGDNRIAVLLKSEPGIFLVDHLGIGSDLLLSSAQPVVVEYSNKIDSFNGLMRQLFKAGIWPDDFLRQNGLVDDDFFTVAQWWDRVSAEKALIDDSTPMKAAGIGLELLYGYTPTLDQYGTDLTIIHKNAHRLVGRKDIVKRIERSFTSGNSVMLTGQPGVGKKTVILEFAHSATEGELSPAMSYRRVVELNSNFVLSESVDLNQKKQKLAQIFAESEAAGNIILAVRDIHRFTNPELEGVDFTDVFEQYLEKRNIKIIAIATDTEYERFIAGNARLRKYFDVIEVKEPSLEEAFQILVQAAGRWEKKRNVTIASPALRRVLEGSNQYISEIPFPEKALELLDAVVTYHLQTHKDRFVSTKDVDKVLTERTGISFAELTEREVHKLTNLEELMHRRLVGQEDAVTLIAQILRSKTVGVSNPNRPIGSFLFLGPTGVGKTETAKVLAKVYFGSESEILRYDMAEYVGKEGLERLVGSVAKNLPGSLTTAIKNKPASLLLLDEIEKAPPEIFNLFLAMLDEGFMTDAFGKRINCRHLFIVATSNAGAEFIRQQVSHNQDIDLQKEVTDYIMKKGLFSPEFINRFDGVVVYKPLTKEQLIKIARILLLELAHILKQKNVYVSISDGAVEKLAEDGFEPEFGARPMRRIIDLSIGDLLGKAILEKQLAGGDRVTILPGMGKNEFKLEKEVSPSGQS